MKNTLKIFTNSKDKKRLISNFLSLATLQFANYLLPLFTLPYLARILGAEYFGLLAFATATITFFQIFTEYGFNLTATRAISINRDDQEKINEIFSSVLIIKTMLMAISFLLLCLIVFSIDKFFADWQIYLLTFGSVLGQVIFPIWFFQGMENMKYITYSNLIAKLLFTISIFVIVKEQSDYYTVPILISLGFIVSGLWSLWVIKRKFKVKFSWQTWTILKTYLIEGWHMFLVSMQSNILSSAGVFILGLFQSNEIVGYYAAVEKVAKAFVGLFAPATQALFPLVSIKLTNSKTYGKEFLFKVGLIILLFALCMSTMMIIFSSKITVLVLGAQYEEYNFILRILSVWLFFGVLNNLIGIQYLTGLGYSNYYLKASLVAGIIALTLFLSLTPFLAINGILVGMIAAEVALTGSMIYLIRKNDL